MGIFKSWTSLQKPQNRFEILLALLLISLPFGQRLIINTLLLFLLLHSLYFLSAHQWLGGLKHSLWLWPAAFFLLHVLSLLWSEDRAEGLRQLETKMSIFIAPLVIAAHRARLTDRSHTIGVLALITGSLGAAVVAFLIAVYRSFTQPSDKFYQYFLYGELSSSFMHPGYLSLYMGIALLACIHYLIQKRLQQRYLWLIFATFLALTLILLQGRISVLALMIIGIVFLFYSIWRQLQHSGKWPSWLIATGAILLVATGFLASGNSLTQRYLQWPELDYDIQDPDLNSATLRLAQWECAKDAIAEQPLLGAGVGGNRQAIFRAYEKNQFSRGIQEQFNVHNQYLETTIVTGFAGLVLLLGMFGSWLRLAWRQKNWFLLAALSFFMLNMLTESLLERAAAVILLAVFFPHQLVAGASSSRSTKNTA